MPESGQDFAVQLALLGDALERLERRLRSLGAAAWRSRATVVRALLTELIAVEAMLRGRSPHELPHIAEFALADALAVIGGDVIEAFADVECDASLRSALSAVRTAIDAAR